MYFESIAGNRDRWNTPSASIDFTGVNVIDGLLSPPTLRPQRWLAFADSITEGTNGDGDSYSAADQSTARSWGVLMAEGWDVEVGVVGFCSQGYSTMGPPRSEVPPFHNTTVNTWAELWRGQPRPFAGIEAVLVNHGTNDLHLADSELTVYITDFLKAFRAANPSIAIHLVVPFGGFKREAFAIAFRAYQAASQDANCRLIDISQRDSALLEDPDGDADFTAYSTDGLHPNQAGHDRIAELVLQALPADSRQMKPMWSC